MLPPLLPNLFCYCRLVWGLGSGVWQPCVVVQRACCAVLLPASMGPLLLGRPAATLAAPTAPSTSCRLPIRYSSPPLPSLPTTSYPPSAQGAAGYATSGHDLASRGPPLGRRRGRLVILAAGNAGGGVGGHGGSRGAKVGSHLAGKNLPADPGAHVYITRACPAGRRLLPYPAGLCGGPLHCRHRAAPLLQRLCTGTALV